MFNQIMRYTEMRYLLNQASCQFYNLAFVNVHDGIKGASH
jgi:hypothetical protein